MRVVLLFMLAGCRARTPTYHHDVAPLFAEHCRECHRQDGVAPVPTLADYASARMYALPIKLAVQTRRMPPWGADDTGLCGTWDGARWLSSQEISTVARWYEGGAPEGDPEPSPAIALTEPRFRADAMLDLGGVYKPGIGPGGNRCLLADPGLDRDRLLDAIRIQSTDARAVAQVTLFALDSAEAESQAAALDEADPGLGYECFGTARVAARLVASWTWPRPVLRLPAGVRLHARRKLVAQIHYDVSKTSSSFQAATQIGLEFDDAAREAQVMAVAATGVLPPGQIYAAVEKRTPVERRLRVLGIAPRMHIRADTMNLSVERGGKSFCLGSFDHWHFNSQQLYSAQKPMTLEPGDRLHLSCAYRTLGRVEPMKLGDRMDEEECVAYLMVTD